jgi:hypothetical protein
MSGGGGSNNSNQRPLPQQLTNVNALLPVSATRFSNNFVTGTMGAASTLVGGYCAGAGTHLMEF